MVWFFCCGTRHDLVRSPSPVQNSPKNLSNTTKDGSAFAAAESTAPLVLPPQLAVQAAHGFKHGHVSLSQGSPHTHTKTFFPEAGAGPAANGAKPNQGQFADWKENSQVEYSNTSSSMRWSMHNGNPADQYALISSQVSSEANTPRLNVLTSEASSPTSANRSIKAGQSNSPGGPNSGSQSVPYTPAGNSVSSPVSSPQVNTNPWKPVRKSKGHQPIYIRTQSTNVPQHSGHAHTNSDPALIQPIPRDSTPPSLITHLPGPEAASRATTDPLAGHHNDHSHQPQPFPPTGQPIDPASVSASPLYYPGILDTSPVAPAHSFNVAMHLLYSSNKTPIAKPKLLNKHLHKVAPMALHQLNSTGNNSANQPNSAPHYPYPYPYQSSSVPTSPHAQAHSLSQSAQNAIYQQAFAQAYAHAQAHIQASLISMTPNGAVPGGIVLPPVLPPHVVDTHESSGTPRPETPLPRDEELNQNHANLVAAAALHAQSFQPPNYVNVASSEGESAHQPAEQLSHPSDLISAAPRSVSQPLPPSRHKRHKSFEDSMPLGQFNPLVHGQQPGSADAAINSASPAAAQADSPISGDGGSAEGGEALSKSTSPVPDNSRLDMSPLPADPTARRAKLQQLVEEFPELQFLKGRRISVQGSLIIDENTVATTFSRQNSAPGYNLNALGGAKGGNGLAGGFAASPSSDTTSPVNSLSSLTRAADQTVVASHHRTRSLGAVENKGRLSSKNSTSLTDREAQIIAQELAAIKKAEQSKAGAQTADDDDDGAPVKMAHSPSRPISRNISPEHMQPKPAESAADQQSPPHIPVCETPEPFHPKEVGVSSQIPPSGAPVPILQPSMDISDIHAAHAPNMLTPGHLYTAYNNVNPMPTGIPAQLPISDPSVDLSLPQSHSHSHSQSAHSPSQSQHSDGEDDMDELDREVAATAIVAQQVVEREMFEHNRRQSLGSAPALC